MISPSVLLDEIVEKLKAIPELQGVEINAYDEESQIYRNPDEARDNLTYGTGMVAFYEGGTFPRSGETRGVRHEFSILLKCSSDVGYFELMPNIYDGVPDDGQCLKFVDHELSGCDPLADFEHRQYRDADGLSYWGIRFAATEK